MKDLFNCRRPIEVLKEYAEGLLATKYNIAKIIRVDQLQVIIRTVGIKNVTAGKVNGQIKSDDNIFQSMHNAQCYVLCHYFNECIMCSFISLTVLIQHKDQNNIKATEHIHDIPNGIKAIFFYNTDFAYIFVAERFFKLAYFS